MYDRRLFYELVKSHCVQDKRGYDLFLYFFRITTIIVLMIVCKALEKAARLGNVRNVQ